MALSAVRPASIRGRLVRTVFAAALVAFAAAAAGLLVFERVTLESRVRAIVEPYAQIVSVGAEAAVAFGDSRRAQEILDSLRANPQILEAQIVLGDGRVLARYGAGPARRLEASADDGVRVGDARDVAEFVHPLDDGARLFVVLDLGGLQRQARNMLLAVGAAMGVLLVAVTFGLLAALQRGIVRPISALAGAVEQVRTGADYTKRVPARGSDELARLGDSFNAMMAAVQQRDEALQQLTALQRTILDHVGSAIVSTRPDGIVTSFNPEAERMLGRSAAEVVGRVTPAVWHDPEELRRRAGQLAAELGEPVAAGFEVFTVRPRRGLHEVGDWTYLRPDGTRLPVQLTVTALRDEAGTVTGYVGLAADLTERQRAEAALRRHKEELEATVRQRTAELQLARDAAEAASRAKSAFLATMSHEIRTPMNAILGMQELALHSGLPPQAQDYVRKAHGAAESLLGILNDILDFSKIEAGRLDLESIPFTLDEVLDKLAGLVGMKAQQAGLELLFVLPPGLPTLHGDPSRLGQVLLNLVGNAVKFTRRGEVVVAVEPLSAGPDGVTLAFEVADTGVGMDAELVARLFEPFAQGDASTSRRFGGTGLGLAICRHLVRLMGGELAVDSAPGRGSRFRFTLPFGCTAAPAGADGDAAWRGRRLLVVDDNARARDVLVGMARACGLSAEAAAEAAVALGQVAAADRSGTPYALLLVDADLPGIDGPGLLREVAAAALRDPPRVMLATGPMARERLAARLADEGLAPAALLGKPVTPAALAEALRTALGLAPRRRAPAPASAPSHAGLAGARILLVEDNEINREIAIALLSRAGMAVDTAENGRLALEALARERYDLVLMDCQMPEMDGYEATRVLRGRPEGQGLPVIAMTANAMVGDRDLALDAGMDDHVAKPVRVDELFATLARWLPAARRG